MMNDQYQITVTLFILSRFLSSDHAITQGKINNIISHQPHAWLWYIIWLTQLGHYRAKITIWRNLGHLSSKAASGQSDKPRQLWHVTACIKMGAQQRSNTGDKLHLGDRSKNTWHVERWWSTAALLWATEEPPPPPPQIKHKKVMWTEHVERIGSHHLLEEP